MRRTEKELEMIRAEVEKMEGEQRSGGGRQTGGTGKLSQTIRVDC
jgi:hypothetical protein